MKNNTIAMDAFEAIPKEEVYFYELTYSIVSQLYEYIGKKNISQKELSRMMHVKESYISRIFTGDQNITIKTIANIMACLDAKMHVKITDEDVQVLFSYRYTTPANNPQYDYWSDGKQYKDDNSVSGEKYDSSLAA